MHVTLLALTSAHTRDWTPHRRTVGKGGAAPRESKENEATKADVFWNNPC